MRVNNSPNNQDAEGLEHVEPMLRVIIPAMFAAAAPITFIIIATIATLAAPGYSSLETPLSYLAAPDYPHPWIISTAFITYGIMVQGLGLALYFSSREMISKVTLEGLVILYGAGGIAAGIFVTGETNIVLLGLSQSTLHGAATLITLVGILSLMASGIFIGPLGKTSPVVRRQSQILLILTIAFVGIFERVNPEFALYGLLQRAFFGTTMLWVFMSSIHITKRHKRSQRNGHI